MARIFLSYARANQADLDRLLPLLQEKYGDEDIHYDETISGGEEWWQGILEQIGDCDLFIYLISDESIESEYCKAQFEEAQKLKRPVLPVLVQTKFKIPEYGFEWLQELRPDIYHLEFEDPASVAEFLDVIENYLIQDTHVSITELFSYEKPSSTPVVGDLPQPVPETRPTVKFASNLNTGRRFVAGITGVASILLIGLVAFGIFQLPKSLRNSVGSNGNSLITEVAKISTEVSSEPDSAGKPLPFHTPTPIVAGPPIMANAQWEPVTREIDGVLMALIPAGCFTIGRDPNPYPTEDVCLDEPFWMDVFEVTNEQYGFDGYFSGDQKPRDNVTWDSAEAFCALRGGRLPNEMEWEYAARGPDNLLYPWGDFFQGHKVVFAANSRRTEDVGTRPSGTSWVGVQNLGGNVSEWVDTNYRPGMEYDPELRMIRGGSFGGGSYQTRATSLFWLDPEDTFADVGFRCMKEDSENLSQPIQ